MLKDGALLTDTMLPRVIIGETATTSCDSLRMMYCLFDCLGTLVVLRSPNPT